MLTCNKKFCCGFLVGVRVVGYLHFTFHVHFPISSRRFFLFCFILTEINITIYVLSITINEHGNMFRYVYYYLEYFLCSLRQFLKSPKQHLHIIICNLPQLLMKLILIIFINHYFA